MSSAQTADGYIRVSRRAGRQGESFISPEVQRKKIADWAKHEVEILAWWMKRLARVGRRRRVVQTSA
jgi:hypothetical protein